LLHRVKFDHLNILHFFAFEAFLNSEEKEKVTWWHVWDVRGVEAPVECGVALKIPAQVGPSAPMPCVNLPRRVLPISWSSAAN
jgi:hypothetical protein